MLYLAKSHAQKSIDIPLLCFILRSEHYKEDIVRKLTWALLASILASMPSLPFAQPANLYTFPGPDVDLGQVGPMASSGQHFIGGRGDTIYVLRQYAGSVYCHKSTDGGYSFSSGVQANSTLAGVNPSLKVDTAGVVYVAYQSGDADIYFTKSIDGGQTFISAVKVNDDTITTVGQERPAIAVNNKGQVFIVWGDRRTNPLSTYMAASYNGGFTFSSNIQVNEPGTSGSYGDIAADDSGRTYVAYWGTTGGKGGIVLARSNDSGQSYTQRVVVNDSLWFTGYFSMAISPNRLLGIAWGGFQDTCTNVLCSVRFSVSSDYGQTFSPSVEVDNSGQPQLPSLAWNYSTFYTAWQATHRRSPTDPYFDHIWFSYSRDSGKTFVPFVDAVPDDSNNVFHSFASVWVSKNEKAYVAWADSRWDPVFEDNYDMFVSVGKP